MDQHDGLEPAVTAVMHHRRRLRVRDCRTLEIPCLQADIDQVIQRVAELALRPRPARHLGALCEVVGRAGAQTERYVGRAKVTNDERLQAATA